MSINNVGFGSLLGTEYEGDDYIVKGVSTLIRNGTVLDAEVEARHKAWREQMEADVRCGRLNDDGSITWEDEFR